MPSDHVENLRYAAMFLAATAAKEVLAAADRLDWLEDTTNEQVMRIDMLEAELARYVPVDSPFDYARGRMRTELYERKETPEPRPLSLHDHMQRVRQERKETP